MSVSTFFLTHIWRHEESAVNHMKLLIKLIVVSAFCFPCKTVNTFMSCLWSQTDFIESRNVICTLKLIWLLIHPRLQYWSLMWMKSTWDYVSPQYAWETSNVIPNIPTEYIDLFTSSSKYKQCFENVINWARSEIRFIVAHPNERGTNIALIILPQNKASICMQRTSVFLSIPL